MLNLCGVIIMWQVEASNAKGDFQIVSSLSQAASRKLHRELSNSGKWAMVRSFDMDSVLRKAEIEIISNQKII